MHRGIDSGNNQVPQKSAMNGNRGCGKENTLSCTSLIFEPHLDYKVRE